MEPGMVSMPLSDTPACSVWEEVPVDTELEYMWDHLLG